MSENGMCTGGTERCPISGCEKILGEGHWYANPKASHSYHTDKEGIARLWEHRDRLDVTPKTEPLATGTVGDRYMNADT